MSFGMRLVGIAIALAVVWTTPLASAQDARAVATDVIYGSVGDRDLLIDIYMPEGVDAPRLVVWVHGGAWRAGSDAR